MSNNDTENFLNSLDSKTYLIVSVVATFLLVVLGIMVSFYLWRFKKREFKVSFVNNRIFICWASAWFINLIFVIIMWLYAASIIPGMNKSVMIFLMVISLVIAVLSGAYLYFFFKYMAMGIDDVEIAFVGERIILNKVQSVEQNDKLNRVYIYYIEGKRSKRKISFKRTTLSGQFVIKNSELILANVEPELQN